MKNSTTTCRRFALSALAYLLASQGNVTMLSSAFTVDPPPPRQHQQSASLLVTPLSSSIATNVNNVPVSSSPSVAEVSTTAAAPSLQKARIRRRSVPSPLELPRHRQPDIDKAKMMMQLELVVGRTAMVSAVILLLVEISTGSSFSDQLSSLL